MIRSEIDDIFASKPKKAPSSVQPVASSSTLPTKKKKDKKRKRNDEHVETDEKPPKRTVPETIVDPSSSSLSGPAPSFKLDKKQPSIVKPKDRKKDREALQQFKDSRGTGPRRKTDEGFAIYKEAELGINIEAGGTPLCPFDCECCF